MSLLAPSPCPRLKSPPSFECILSTADAPLFSPCSPCPNPGSKNPASWNRNSPCCGWYSAKLALRCGGMRTSSLDARRWSLSVGSILRFPSFGALTGSKYSSMSYDRGFVRSMGFGVCLALYPTMPFV